MSALFVTGTGTGVGKTFTSALLVRQLRARGAEARAVKPVISGFDANAPDHSDSATLLDAAGELATPEMIAAISPWRFAAPLAPNMAARRVGEEIDFEKLVAWCRDAARTADGPLIVEGVGGAMVPITDSTTVLDWVAALAVPALVVGGNYLGAISHALTAVAALRMRDVPLAGIVICESTDGVALRETVETLGRFMPDVPIVTLPRLLAGKDWRLLPDLTGLVMSGGTDPAR